MKQFLRIFFSVVLCFSIFSCDKDDQGSKESPSASYYVKYQASSGNTYHFLESITVATDHGDETLTGRTKSWSQVFGPVPQGFHAKISVKGGRNPFVQIYVCKGEEPFSLKQTGSGSGEANASYVIDF